MSPAADTPRPAGRRLWLVRHPRPCVPEGVCYGATDVPVDPDHLRVVQSTLAAQLPLRAHWRVSALSRAGALAAALQPLRAGQPPAQVDPRLNEMDFGRWEMQAWDAISAAALQAWTDDFQHHRCGHGESVAMLMARVGAVWQEARLSPGSEDEVWFTHAGVMRAVQLLQVGHRPDPNRPLWATDWPRTTVPFGGVMVWPLT